jgi:uncharacterized protein (DUF433 family)
LKVHPTRLLSRGTHTEERRQAWALDNPNGEHTIRVGGDPLEQVPAAKKEVRGVLDRITFDPGILGGRACIRGMRIPVSVIVGQVAHGASEAEILADYPDLEPEDIQEALEYAAWLTHEEVHVP